MKLSPVVGAWLAPIAAISAKLPIKHVMAPQNRSVAASWGGLAIRLCSA
jgi:hypothetical protein